MFLYSLVIINGKSEDDDFAVCRAWSKKQAIKKFKKMYCNAMLEDCVSRIKFNCFGISVLSDY